MAEKDARSKLQSAAEKLEILVSRTAEFPVNQEEFEDSDPPPTVRNIERIKDKLNTVWPEVKDKHEQVRLVSKDATARADAIALDQLEDKFLDAIEACDALLQLIQPPEDIDVAADAAAEAAAVVRRQQQQKDSLISDKDLEEGVIKNSLAAIEAQLTEDEGHSHTSLDAHLGILQGLKGRMQEVKQIYAGLRQYFPDEAAVYAQQRMAMETHFAAAEMRITVAAGVKRAPLPAQVQASVAGSVTSVNTSSSGVNPNMYYQKRSFPKFDGNVRNYMGFRREWRETLADYPVALQLREIKMAVPKLIEPDLKNLDTMEKIWDVLNKEYGDTSYNTSLIVEELISITVEGKTDLERFTCIQRAWNKAISDLDELGKKSVLDNEVILNKIATKFNTALTKQMYSMKKLSPEMKDKSQLEVMEAFMSEHRDFQKTNSRLDGAPSNKKQEENRSCNLCSQVGHIAKNCKKNIKRNNGTKPTSPKDTSHSTQVSSGEKPCPACKETHMFSPTRGADKRPGCRFSQCDVFKNMSLTERGRILQSNNGCQVCLDWTGHHTRENCVHKARGCPVVEGGTKCGGKHHALIHKSPVNYCNLVQATRWYKQAEMPPELKSLDEKKVREELQVVRDHLDQDVDRALLPIQYVEVACPGTQAAALFDSGSNVNLITSRLAKRLGLVGLTKRSSMVSTGGREEVSEHKVYRLELFDKFAAAHQIYVFEIPDISGEMNEMDTRGASGGYLSCPRNHR